MSRYRGVQKHGSGWRAAVCIPGTRSTRKGPVRRTRGEAADDAERLRRELQATYRPGAAITLQQAHERLMQRVATRGRREATLTYYAAQLAALSQVWDPAIPLRAIQPTAIEHLIDVRRREGVSDATIRKHIGYLATLIQSAIDSGMFAGPNVAKAVDRPDSPESERVVMPLADLIAAQNRAAARGWHREAATLKALRLSGLRRSELAAVRLADLTERGLVVRRPKVRSLPRVVPASAALRGVLRFLAGGGDGRIFSSPDEITAACRRVARMIGDPRIRAHAIRHGVGDAIAAATGGDVTTVGRVLGHAPGSARITLRYCAPHDERLRAAQRALERPPGS